MSQDEREKMGGKLKKKIHAIYVKFTMTSFAGEYRRNTVFQRI